MSKSTGKPLVAILMGSKNDWETMQAAGKILDEFGIAYEAKVASAHRSPELVAEYAKTAEERGLEVMIGAAGLAAHLAGVIASMTLLPVLGVPMQGNAVGGLDALLSMVQMPGGVPVGGQTRLDIPNDHLQYAITWFLLAAALAGVYLAYHWENGRLTVAGRTKVKT